MSDMIGKEAAALAVANVEIGYHDGISGDWHPHSGPAIIRAACAAIRALHPADDAPQMRPETESEHIARDMREGRFPARSELQMVPIAALPPADDAVEAQVKAEHTRLSMTPAQFANMERWRGYTEGLDAMRDAALAAIRAGVKP